MLLLYGANGYTAQLMLPLLRQQQLPVILAGRSAEKIQPLAEVNALPFRVFDLNDPAAVDKGLSDCTAVLHCAGPFKYTARPMMEGCIRNRVHYLDITGELDVFELAASLSKRAAEAGIMLMPGVGFDVVPTDCIAKTLQLLLPDATHLTLAFATEGGGVSRGTAKTAAEDMSNGAIRQEGVITRIPLGHRAQTIDFEHKSVFCMAVPWGDVASAFYTTGIPNIEVLVKTHPNTYKQLKRWGWLLKWYNRIGFVKKRILKSIDNRPAGPDEAKRTKGRIYLWGEVRNAKGETRQTRHTTAEGYTFTAFSGVHIAIKVLNGLGRPGFQTPAGLWGKELLSEIEREIWER